MRTWVFSQEQFETALAQWAEDQDIGPATMTDIRAFLNSNAAVHNKLVLDIKPRLDAPLSPADIKEPKHGNPSDQVAKP